MRLAEACLDRPVIVCEIARSALSQPTWPPSYAVWLGGGHWRAPVPASAEQRN